MSGPEVHKRDPRNPDHGLCCVVIGGGRGTVAWEAVTCPACLSWREDTPVECPHNGTCDHLCGACGHPNNCHWWESEDRGCTECMRLMFAAGRKLPDECRGWKSPTTAEASS